MRRHRTKSVSTRIGTRRNGLPLGAPWGRSGVPAPPHAVLLCTNSEPAPRLALRVYAVTAYTHRAPPAPQTMACGATGQGPASRTATGHPASWPLAADPNMPEPRRLEQNCQNAREAATTRTGHETVETRRHGTPTRARARIHVQCIHRRTRTHAHTHTRTHTHTWTKLKAEGRLGAQTFDSPRPR